MVQEAAEGCGHPASVAGPPSSAGTHPDSDRPAWFWSCAQSAGLPGRIAAGCHGDRARPGILEERLPRNAGHSWRLTLQRRVGAGTAGAGRRAQELRWGLKIGVGETLMSGSSLYRESGLTSSVSGVAEPPPGPHRASFRSTLFLTLPTAPWGIGFITSLYRWASLGAQTVQRLPTMRKTWVQSLGREDLLETEMATHSSTLAWGIPWMEEPGGLQSTGSQRVRHD